LYTATLTELRQTDEWFWNQTPRVIVAMLDEVKRIKRADYKTLAIYTALAVWGKEIPDGEQAKEEALPGRDFPADENMLSAFG
jgi:hypothetical protein